MKYNEISEELKKQLNREWLITNGIGGFASQSAIGVNTRKYHGLLVAPLTPPGRRFLVLSKVDESIEIGEKQYNLYSNVCNGEISEGFRYMVDFKKEYIPIYTYKVEDIEIKKFICMKYGENTVTILYRVISKNSKAKLTLAPIVNFRDFHCTNTNHKFDVKQIHYNNKVKITIDGNSHTPIYINCSEGKYMKHVDDTFYNMYYEKEAERGFTATENHTVPGVYNINIYPHEEKDITFVCSLEENIDEIDAIALHRSFQSLRGDVAEIVNSLLTEMDGINDNKAVVTIGATNNPNSIDYAVRSRFEEEIEFVLPDDNERKSIFENNLKTFPLKYDLNIEKLVKISKNMSGRDIKEKILKTALHHAISHDKETVDNKDVEYALKASKIKNSEVKGMFE